MKDWMYIWNHNLKSNPAFKNQVGKIEKVKHKNIIQIKIIIHLASVILNSDCNNIKPAQKWIAILKKPPINKIVIPIESKRLMKSPIFILWTTLKYGISTIEAPKLPNVAILVIEDNTITKVAKPKARKEVFRIFFYK